MVTLTFEEAIQLCRRESINAALEFTLDASEYILFNVRLTPWRNSSRGDVMVLGAAHSFQGALIVAAEQVANERWVPLNWKVRLAEPGVYAPSEFYRSQANGRAFLKVVSDEAEDPHPREHTGGTRSGATG